MLSELGRVGNHVSEDLTEPMRIAEKAEVGRAVRFQPIVDGWPDEDATSVEVLVGQRALERSAPTTRKFRRKEGSSGERTKSKGMRSRVRAPFSILEKSRMLLMMPSRLLPQS